MLRNRWKLIHEIYQDKFYPTEQYCSTTTVGSLALHVLKRHKAKVQITKGKTPQVSTIFKAKPNLISKELIWMLS